MQFEILTISSLRRELPPTRTLKWPGRNFVQISCNTLNAFHVQPGVCHLVRRDSSAIKTDRVKIAFIVALFRWLKLLTDEGNEIILAQKSGPRWSSGQASASRAGNAGIKRYLPWSSHTTDCRLVLFRPQTGTVQTTDWYCTDHRLILYRPQTGTVQTTD